FDPERAGRQLDLESQGSTHRRGGAFLQAQLALTLPHQIEILHGIAAADDASATFAGASARLTAEVGSTRARGLFALCSAEAPPAFVLRPDEINGFFAAPG